MNSLFGVRFTDTHNLKEEYRPHSQTAVIEFHLHRPLRVRISDAKQYREQPRRRRFFRRRSRPVPESEWVSPDRESLKLELVINLVYCLIMKENSKEYKIADMKASMLLGILHGKAPKNPQVLEMIYPEPYLQRLHEALGSDAYDRAIKSLNKRKKKSRVQRWKNWERNQLWKLIKVKLK